MNKEVEFYFRRMIDGELHYAGILLCVSIDATPNQTQGQLLMNYEDSSPYLYAVRFAVEYFFEHFSAAKPYNLLVDVLQVKDLLMDTSGLDVFYATTMALSEALDFNIPAFAFIQDSAILNLPLPKKIVY
jgi:hypothetical protein